MIVQESHISSKSVAPANIRLRPMQESDLPDVHRLEVMSQPIPWPRWFFRRQLRKGASCWVLEEGNKIVGFGIIAFVKDWAHIMNMCVERDYRRRGLGRRIMLHLLGLANRRHCRRVWLEVRPSNWPAILLYRKLGFHKKMIRKGYYRTRTGRQNGVVMVRALRTAIRE